MNYTEIFEEVISIMEFDSATCKDMGAGDAEIYKSLICDDMSEGEFTLTVKKYIASFGLEGHLSFNNTRMGRLDFEVMRYGDVLYVTAAATNSKLQKKDRITAIDGKEIALVAEERSEFLMRETNERQGRLWVPILMFAKSITVLRDQEELEIPIELGKCLIETEPYSYRTISDDTLLIKLLDFGDENAIREVYTACADQLDTCKNLIIDVRKNAGGADTAFLPLLEYCYPEGKSIDEFLPKAEPIAINYSIRNCAARLAMLDQFFGDQIPEDVRPMVDAVKEELQQNRGKGFLAAEGQDEELGIVGRKNPKKVWILTDQNCGSSGDAFVQMVSYSPKVEIVGRPTMGITDYSNCASACWENFAMVYPTSRDGSIDKGCGLAHKGVAVDHYIPWTPEYLDKDLDLKYVLEQINK